MQLLRIIHFGHSCVLLETDSARLLVDPGTFSSGFDRLTGLDAVLVTHQHPDHLDVQRLEPLLAANPDADVLVDEGTAQQLGELAHRVLRPGDRVEISGADVEVVGGDHAVIHPDIPIIPNNGYLVDGTVLHPGDSFTRPAEITPELLLLPAGAPWMKASEAVDYLRQVTPPLAVPIHQAVLAMPELHHRLFENLKPSGTELRIAEHGEPFEVG